VDALLLAVRVIEDRPAHLPGMGRILLSTHPLLAKAPQVFGKAVELAVLDGQFIAVLRSEFRECCFESPVPVYSRANDAPLDCLRQLAEGAAPAVSCLSSASCHHDCGDGAVGVHRTKQNHVDRGPFPLHPYPESVGDNKKLVIVRKNRRWKSANETCDAALEVAMRGTERVAFALLYLANREISIDERSRCPDSDTWHTRSACFPRHESQRLVTCGTVPPSSTMTMEATITGRTISAIFPGSQRGCHALHSDTGLPQKERSDFTPPAFLNRTQKDADLLIAATAMEHGLVLVSGNTSDFSWITGLTLADWRQP
jgi:hypothetical protein